ncbi:AAA family ATPase [Shewanella algae]|uniref:5-methylcytosine-specific restriction enzyme B n=1 Tax=Shewanella algae TaxID=38313 RepID=A0A380BSK5_9GAMM|nr:AAA family ATPase [Shewanella algae]SUJ05136.1 5-methylcytosine-specific restriction enzyme B [Shewanella algae]
MPDYSWVAAFKTLADWLSGYENRQSELVQILRDIGIDRGLEDELADGSRVDLTVIDPFTFFATFMKYGVGKRQQLFATLFSKIGLDAVAPTGFDGVPTAQPLKVWLFPYAKERSETMVPDLWALFHQVRAGQVDGDLFNRILKIPHTGFAKLTECMFYLAPDQHFPVDAQTKPWLAARGRELPKENWQGYQDLLAWLQKSSEQPFYEISYQAWSENKTGNSSTDFSAKSADDYLNQRYPNTRSGTSHLTAFKTVDGRQLAFDPGKNPESKSVVKIFVDSPPPEAIFQNVQEYLPEESRNHHLKTHAPALSQGNPAWLIALTGFQQLEQFCNWYEGNSVKEIKMTDSATPKATKTDALNQILYGPPGTGKTYATTEKAVALADPQWLAELASQELSVLEQRKAVKRRYDELVAAKRIAFTTFHQSFSYEDFIEGIRAETKDGQVSYCIEDGVFKALAERANKDVVNGQSLGLSDSPAVWKISIGPTQEKAMRDRYIQAGEARIGWNQTGNLSLELDERTQEQQAYWNSLTYRNHDALNAFSNDIKVGDVLLCLKNVETVQAVGVVTSDYVFDESVTGAETDYSHVRKVNWLLTDIDLNILPLNDDKRMVQQTVYPLSRISWNSLVDELHRQNIALPFSVEQVGINKRNYVLIIDEINRGNISRIFGELITLLEPDKRKGGSDERSVTLPYSKEAFSVPDNLYVLGTMNTADKSLAQLDLALRRRFEFVELMPDPALLDGILVHGVDISELLNVMNQRIEVLLDRDHTIGHAYFWPLLSVEKEEERQQLLADIFAKRIIPLLQEYFFADWERIGWVLNDSQKPAAERFIELDDVGTSLGKLFLEAIANQITDRRYRINKPAFMEAGAYRGILPGAGVSA